MKVLKNTTPLARYLTRLFLFLLPVILLVYPLDCAFSYLLLQKKYKYSGELEVWNDLLSSRINSDVVIYGSSRAWTHFDPEILQEATGLDVYNLGLDAHDFWFQYARHKYLLRYNPKPAVILLSLDSFCLIRRKDFYNYTQVLPFMLWDRFLYDHTKRYIGFSTPEYFLPLLRYAGESTALASSMTVLIPGANKNKLRYRGYAGRDEYWNNDFENAKNEHGQMKMSIETESRELLFRFLEECKNDSIEVILVYSPVYIEGQQFITNRDEIMEFYENTAASFGVCFLDYSNSEICQKREYFYNSTHLNRTGAELFSHELAADLNKNTAIRKIQEQRKTKKDL